MVGPLRERYLPIQLTKKKETLLSRKQHLNVLRTPMILSKKRVGTQNNTYYIFIIYILEEKLKKSEYQNMNSGCFGAGSKPMDDFKLSSYFSAMIMYYCYIFIACTMYF